MALGTVVTAKGKRLDFAELVRYLRRPIQPVADPTATVTRQQPLAKEIRARGHIPTLNGVSKPVVAAVVPPPEAAAPKPTRVVENRSLADYTGVTIDEPKHLKERPENPVQSANEALAQILSSDQRRSRDPAKMGKKA